MKRLITLTMLLLSVVTFGQTIKLTSLTQVENGVELKDAPSALINGRMEIDNGLIYVQLRYDYPIDVLQVSTEPITETQIFRGVETEVFRFKAYEPSTFKTFDVAFIGDRDVVFMDEDKTIIWLTYTID